MTKIYILFACAGSYDDYREFPLVASLDENKILKIKEDEAKIQTEGFILHQEYRKIVYACENSLADEEYSHFEDEEFQKFVRELKAISSKYSNFDYSEYHFEDVSFLIKKCPFIEGDE